MKIKELGYTYEINSPYKDELIGNFPLLVNELEGGHAISTSGENVYVRFDCF